MPPHANKTREPLRTVKIPHVRLIFKCWNDRATDDQVRAELSKVETDAAKIETAIRNFQLLDGWLENAWADIAVLMETLYAPGDLIEFRLVSSESRYVESSWLTEVGPGNIAEFIRKNLSGYNAYFGVNPRPESDARKDKDITIARCLFADFDDCDISKAKERCGSVGLPNPSLAVLSGGGGCHFYWRLQEPMTDLARWKNVMIRLYQVLGSDRQVCHASRVMRLPGGFRNWKYNDATAKLSSPPSSATITIEEVEDILSRAIAVGREQERQRAREAERQTGTHSAPILAADSDQSWQRVRDVESQSIRELDDLENSKAMVAKIATSLDEAISMTLPKKIGERNRSIFEFGRHLKAMAEYAELKVTDRRLHDAARQWHREGRRRGVIGTEDEQETVNDLRNAWDQICFPAGKWDWADVQAKIRLAPAWIDRCANGKILKLCWALSQYCNDSGNFFLSGRTAHEQLGISDEGARKMLNVLVQDGVLRIVAKGNQIKATRYQFLGKPPQDSAAWIL